MNCLEDDYHVECALVVTLRNLVAVTFAEQRLAKTFHRLVEECDLRIDGCHVDELVDLLDLGLARVRIVDDGNQEVEKDYLNYQLVCHPCHPNQVNVELLEELDALSFEVSGPCRVTRRSVIAYRVPPNLYKHALMCAQFLVVLIIVINAKHDLREAKEEDPPDEEGQEVPNIANAPPEKVDQLSR